MQLFYASPALGVQSPTRQPSLLSNSLRSFYMRVSAHSMRAHHLGLARGETVAGKHSINIYIYIWNACFARSFAGRKIYRALRINFQGKGGGRNERSSCVTREIISSVRSVLVFFIRVDAEREREKERGKNDSIKFVWGEHPWMMSNVYVILSVIYRDCKSAR